MDIQRNQTQESFEKLYVKNAPDWSLERDQDGGYKYHATQSAFLLFEQQQVEIDLLKAELAKAQAVPEGFVVFPKKQTSKMRSLARDFDARLSLTKYEQLHNIWVKQAMIEAQEPAND
ncbi:hypothetical protein [Acinetobacter terrae]|uniref:hypothetical protein n=1 Tax=Acinetobacter terrae TaxID=2731247 RepID=UPI001F1ECC0B|nr:hypothetical protein [Acinetobacter terrae]